MELKVRLTGSTPIPRHAMPGDAGLDLTSRESVLVHPGETKLVSTGVACEIPEGYFGLIAPRSGLASNHGITLANTPSVIDSSFRGTIKLALHNIGRKGYAVQEGERVAQMIIMSYETCVCVPVDELSPSERGTGGFGSTGSM